jgi:hypothetical protein
MENPMSDTVQHLGVEFGDRFYTAAFDRSEEARAIAGEMTGRGLRAQPERTHVFNVISPDSLKSVAVSITPFTGKKLDHEGGLSISEGGHAQGVTVELKGEEIVGFTHYAVTGGRVVSSHHTVAELAGSGAAGALSEQHIRAFAERIGKVRAAQPLIEIQPRQVRMLANVGFNGLVADASSRAVHSEAEISALRGQTNIVAEIALFVLFRTQGSACCSCSCSCWGCSSCSSSIT